MVSLRDKRVQDILTMVYKGLYNMAPTTFGQHSFKYLAVSAWNSLSDELRMSDTLAAFKRGVRSYISSVD